MAQLKRNRDAESDALREGSLPALPQPRWRWMIGLIAAVTATLSFRAVLGYFLVNPYSDQYIAGYGFRDFAAQSLRDGRGFPQWNPYLFGGMPYVAAMHGDIFYPTFLLRLIMRTDLAMTWGFIIHLFLAGAFTTTFLRSLRHSRWAATFGGIAYMLSGPIASYASPGHDGKLFVSTLLPLALWMLVLGIRDGKLFAWGALALTIGLAVLTPHPQLLQYMLLVCGAFALVLAFTSVSEPRAFSGAPASASTSRARFAVTRLSAAACMVGLGFLIGAIQYWPVLGYINASPRAEGREYDFATSYSFPPEELINTYLPQFSGILERYWGRNGIHLHSEYLGIAVLMLAPLSLLALRTVSATRATQRADKVMTRFWLAVALIAFLWMLGGFTPFYHLVYAVIPGTPYFRAPSTMIFVLMFALCALAATGFDLVFEQRVPAAALRRYVIGWATFGMIALVLSASGLFTDLAQNLGHDIAVRTGRDTARFAQYIDANATPTTLGALRSVAFVCVVGTLLWLASLRSARASTIAWMLLLAAGTDLWTVVHSYWRFSPPASSLYRDDPIIRYLKQQREPGRVFVYAQSADYRALSDPYFGMNGLGEGSGMMVHHIRSVSGYHGNELARYAEVMSGNARGNPGFWRHENVRWLYTNHEMPDSLFRLILGPVSNSAGSRSYLYAAPGDNDYAWVASGYGGRDDESALREIYRDNFDPRSIASVDTATVISGARVHPAPALLPDPSTIKVTTTAYGPGFATLQLNTPATEGNALVVSENFYKGWIAKVDGKDAPVMRASFNLIGVPLPAGAKTVTLSFRDTRYDAGKRTTILAFVVAVALTALGWRLSRPR
ncbi:MAG: hypothetical protein ACO1Q7_11380 [Gemmatimonas sp.]